LHFYEEVEFLRFQLCEGEETGGCFDLDESADTLYALNNRVREKKIYRTKEKAGGKTTACL
jgi:hypothetical protein